MERAAQRPLELILARNLLSALSTPALLVDRSGEIVFYNEAAGALLGRPFEESGPISAGDWTKVFGPFDDSDRPIPFDQLPLSAVLKESRPAHGTFTVRSLSRERHVIEAAMVPVVGGHGFEGGMVFFWESA